MRRPKIQVYPRTVSLLKRWKRWMQQDGFPSLSAWVCRQIEKANEGRK